MQTNPSPHLHYPPSSLPFPFLPIPHRPICPKPLPYSTISIAFPPKTSIFRDTHIAFSSPREDLNRSRDAHARDSELELLGKPSPIPVIEEAQQSDTEEPLQVEEALAPFLKFFNGKRMGDSGVEGGKGGTFGEEEKVVVEYYEPKSGDLVVGVVVSGNERRLDVNVGGDMLGTMLTKEVLPLHDGELKYGLCDPEKDAEEFLVSGKIGVVKDEDALSMERMPGRPAVEVGTILFAEVLGRTLSGRPLLSTRRMFRRVAWHRVRQIQQLNEPVEIRITEWNTGGLITRVEGLRAFLPKAELMNRVNNFTDLKGNVGRNLRVCISRIDEANNDLIISEREAWDLLNLQEGTLLEGTIRKIFTFGAQVMIGETNRSGLLHISNITRARVGSVSDLLKVGEKVKVLVVKSMFPDKISLSIADLESEPGLFLSDKEKVFSEAEEMAKRYRWKLPAASTIRKMSPPTEVALPFDDEAKLYANWKWFRFEQHNEHSGVDPESVS